MPFERRSDVQVLEDDRSEYLLQRTTAIAGVFGRLTLSARGRTASGM